MGTSVMDMEPRKTVPWNLRPGAIAGGIILVALGGALLLDRTGTIDIQTGHLIAPLILIVLGATMMFEKGAVVYSKPVRDEQGDVRLSTCTRGGSAAGLWLLGIGVWMLISQNHFWGLTFQTSWPLFIVLAGLTIAIRGWR
jgi:hypothetical protein